MLVLVRGVGRSIYIGRDMQVTVLEMAGEGEERIASLLFVHPRTVGLSGPGVGMAAHVEEQYRAERRTNGDVQSTAFAMHRGDAVMMGRGVTVVLDGFEDRTGEARIGIEAPRHMAVSRDDFTFEQHMQFQFGRESRGREA